jgi:hypothetical protein
MPQQQLNQPSHPTGEFVIDPTDLNNTINAPTTILVNNNNPNNSFITYHNGVYPPPTLFMYKYGYNSNILFENLQKNPIIVNNTASTASLDNNNASELDIITMNSGNNKSTDADSNRMNDDFECHIEELARIKLEDIDELNKFSTGSNPSNNNSSAFNLFKKNDSSSAINPSNTNSNGNGSSLTLSQLVSDQNNTNPNLSNRNSGIVNMLFTTIFGGTNKPNTAINSTTNTNNNSMNVNTNNSVMNANSQTSGMMTSTELTIDQNNLLNDVNLDDELMMSLISDNKDSKCDGNQHQNNSSESIQINTSGSDEPCLKYFKSL